MESGPVTSKPGALAHLRVCDFTGVLAGAGATRTLAAFGAQVIRVEDPVREGRWDILRGSRPFKDERRGVNFGGAFNHHNVEKLGITLNLRSERGRRILRDLVAISDVVTENFAAGVMARLGFAYEDLARIRPDVVYVSNCGFGHTGPYSPYKTWGPVVQAMCGLTFGSGLRDQPPAGWGYAYMDHQGANFMVLAVLAALVHRARTGEGQWVDMACTEAGATLCGPEVLDATVNARPLRRPGSPDSNRSRSPVMAPHGVYPAAGDDRWVAIACRDDRDWTALARLITEAWAADPRWETLDGRVGGEDALDGRIAGWTGTQDACTIAATIRGVGVPAAAVARAEDRIDHDVATRDWGLFPTVTHSAMGRVRVDGLPVHLSRTDWALERGGPCLGEHNDLVYGTLLGIDADEREALHQDGVI
jgi:benzylsuccinate CoA-transferase BbsF subunit